jgi:sigma-B regulation protein RsbU (phosphoserine phosphatase)
LADEALRTNLQQIGGKHYMTLTALCIDGGTVRYAGLHQDLLIYRAARQTVERIETRGVWLGVSEEDISELLQDDELSLEAEDVLLLYTDGYTEAKVAGRMFGVAGLAHVFTELCRNQLPCAALITGLLEALKPATVQDDVTLVALRRLGNLAIGRTR